MNKNVSETPKRGFAARTVDKETLYVRKGYTLVRCEGECHTTGGDGCMLCMGVTWGWVVRAIPGAPKALTAKEKREIAESLGLTAVRGAVSGKVYFE